MGQPLSAMRYALKGLATLTQRRRTGDLRPDDDAHFEACLATMHKQLDKAGAMIARVREYASQKDRRIDTVDLCDVLDEVLNETRLAAQRHPRIEVRRPEGPVNVTGNALELYLLTYNLLKNALEAAGSEGAVGVALACEAGAATLSVVTDGRPLSEEDLKRLGRPFESDKAAGLGLGLSIVQSIAEAHRGRLTFLARPEGGLTVTLVLPAARAGVTS